METIKVSIDVNINLSQTTKDFLKGLMSETVMPIKPAVAEAAIPVKPVVAEAMAPAASQPTASTQAKPAPSKTVTIEMIRAAVSAKSGTHRDELRAKLTEFGAKNVTGLVPEHYEEFLDYINSL